MEEPKEAKLYGCVDCWTGLDEFHYDIRVTGKKDRARIAEVFDRLHYPNDYHIRIGNVFYPEHTMN